MTATLQPIVFVKFGSRKMPKGNTPERPGQMAFPVYSPSRYLGSDCRLKLGKICNMWSLISHLCDDRTKNALDMGFIFSTPFHCRERIKGADRMSAAENLAYLLPVTPYRQCQVSRWYVCEYYPAKVAFVARRSALSPRRLHVNPFKI